MRDYLNNLNRYYRANATGRMKKRVKVIIRKMMLGIITKEKAIRKLTDAILGNGKDYGKVKRETRLRKPAYTSGVPGDYWNNCIRG